MRNTTTIESLENEKIEKLLRKGIIQSDCKIYPYDLGSWIANVKTVFGPRFYLWLFPLKGVEGSGLSFPINPSLLDSQGKTIADIEWPPVQYYDYKAGRLGVGSRDSYISSSAVIVESSSDEDDVDDKDEEEEVEQNDTEFGPSFGNRHYREPKKNQNLESTRDQYESQRRRVVRRGSEGYLVRDNLYPTYSSRYNQENQEMNKSNGSDDDDIPLLHLQENQKRTD
ncbi:Palmitoyltransferase [Physocladia obscura]|uniref:Palmitoyltransferase n=1 Tax=Physocladia obscura TaxID=109957 RepID=A0AAD5TAA1_9FUNG|nr:Palmitoyltransferase [Physocladia obscura]